jgi:tRNA(adenine34) deaminase
MANTDKAQLVKSTQAAHDTRGQSAKKSNQHKKSSLKSKDSTAIEVRDWSDDGSNEVDASYMRQAMLLAENAQAIGEVPVGAIVVVDSLIIGQGYNQSITTHDPSAHAEMLAMREAAKNLQNYRLVDATLYVTLEPCPMCAGLLVHGRVKRIVFGAYDQKTGATGTVMNLVQHESLNHKIEVTGGCLQDECSTQISDFFKQRRRQKKS